MSASAYTSFEKPAPHVGVRAPAHVAEVRSAIRAGQFAKSMLDVWSGMDMTVRLVLVMIASGQVGDPHRIARQPWDSFSPADQLAMGSAARLIVSSLSSFAAVA
jgi:hypothetical protein